MEALPEDTKLQEVDRQLEEEIDEMEAKVGKSNTVLSYTPEYKRIVSLQAKSWPFGGWNTVRTLSTGDVTP